MPDTPQRDRAGATGADALRPSARDAGAAPVRASEAETLTPAARAVYDFLAPAQAADELGRLGAYRVLRVLGSGGMGVVFQAEDTQLGRMIALKVLRPGQECDEAARQRFVREARAAAAVEHDHIITIHQVGEDRGVPFIAMPLLRGESLDDRLRRERRLPVREVLRIGREVAEGLAAAHDAGLVHRDVKPSNIWLEGARGRVKLLDFGLVRPSGSEPRLTQSGTVLGTPQFLSPEQARGQLVDARSDLFSLGCVLYLLATGELPFHGTDTVSAIVAVVTDTPRLPRDLNPDVPVMFSELLLRMLAKEPAGRPASAGEVVAALTAMEDELCRAALSLFGPTTYAIVRTGEAGGVAPVGTPAPAASATLVLGQKRQPRVKVEPESRERAFVSLRRAVGIIGLLFVGFIGGGIGGGIGKGFSQRGDQMEEAVNILIGGMTGAIVGAICGWLAGRSLVEIRWASRVLRERSAEDVSER